MRVVIPSEGRIITCVCGICVKCLARQRKNKQEDRRVEPDYRLWPESYKFRYFQSIARDLLGPDANLQSCLRSRRPSEAKYGRNFS